MRIFEEPFPERLPGSVIDPHTLAFGLAYTTDGDPLLALIIDGRLAVRIPPAALDELVRQLGIARLELARMAPMSLEIDA